MADFCSFSRICRKTELFANVLFRKRQITQMLIHPLLPPQQVPEEPTPQRRGKRNVMHVHTGHTYTRDCLRNSNLYFDRDRNDQCKVCHLGGPLTEGTRCNIVWHASCLQPVLPFPLRSQDAIVCGDECWDELIREAARIGSTTPTREHPY